MMSQDRLRAVCRLSQRKSELNEEMRAHIEYATQQVYDRDDQMRHLFVSKRQ